jgi:hypothetical protein
VDVVLFGGYDGSSILGDTWTWDGAAWVAPCIESKTPTERFGAAMATLNSTAILFGGLGQNSEGVTQILGDTWTWNGAGWSREHVPAPSPRDSTTMATLNGNITLFGGVPPSGTEDADTWTWNGANREARNVVGPRARHDTAMATLEGVVVLFGALLTAAGLLRDGRRPADVA